MPIDQRVAIVTGAAGGIGAACARALAETGLAVVIADLKAGQAEQTAAQLRSQGHEALAIGVDVASRPAVERMVAQTVEAYGRIDVLVNDAGVIVPGQHPFLEMSDETWQRIIDVNLTGMFYCSQAAARVMAGRRAGSIVNITSIGAVRPRRGASPITRARAA